MIHFPVYNFPRHLALFFPVALCAFAVDFFTKRWALHSLTYGDSVQWVLDGVLGFQLRFNFGASFSFAQNATLLFTVIGFFAVVIIPLFIGKSRLWTVVLAFVWAGATGNFVDRLFSGEFGRGGVIDFIVYGDWFTGNVADIYLVLGMMCVAVFLFRGFSPLVEGEMRG